MEVTSQLVCLGVFGITVLNIPFHCLICVRWDFFVWWCGLLGVFCLFLWVLCWGFLRGGLVGFAFFDFFEVFL